MSTVHSRRFGQRPPPVSKLIKAILDRYPDGQIFKELIQNADDAGAKVVRFYIDGRRHPIRTLPTHKLAAYQGPALIAANDAAFTDADWEGIQQPQDSIKAENPFNVGKYGIGFNSVYHITDVPFVVSGKRLVCLDPQEKIWPGDPGQCYDLKSLKGTDILVPFNGIEGFDYHKTTNFPRTLFRFPLRNKASGLSDNTYDVESLRELIDQLKEETNFLLLFLRSVHTIEVYDIPQLERGNLTLCFSIKVAPECQSTVTCHREDFLTKLKRQHSSNPFKISHYITDAVNFDVQINDSSRTGVQSMSWLVANQVGSSYKCILDAAAKQHVFPWVGVAMQLDPSPAAEGRVFCFLPMPVETSSGLPVHINGTFGLNDDRRTIKWPAKDRRNDPTAQWNQMLLGLCIPSCYEMLLKEAVKCSIAPDSFYQALPCIDTIGTSHWSLLLEPLYELIFKWKCLWSMQFNEWVGIDNAIIVTEEDGVPEVVELFLVGCGLKVVKLPDHIHQALAAFYHGKLSTVSPRLVRQRLKANQSRYKRVSEDQKLKLLKYCLLDKKFSSLNKLELIPLANKSFQTFSDDEDVKPLYVCSKTFPKELLPNDCCDHILIDLKDRSLQSSLADVADSDYTQLYNLDNVVTFSKLLRRCYPKRWKNKDTVTFSHEFPTEWFPKFWKKIQDCDLSNFKDMFIIPIATESVGGITMTVTRLTTASDSSVVLFSDDQCSKIMLKALQKFGVLCTMSSCFPYLKHDNLFYHINRFNPRGVLTAISNSCADVTAIKLSSIEATELQRFLASDSLLLSQISHSQAGVLTTLRIFKVLGSDKCLSLQKASNLSWNKTIVMEPPNFSFNKISLPCSMIILSRNNELCLKGTCLSDDIKLCFPDSDLSFISKHLLPLIEEKQCPETCINSLMERVLQLIPIIKRVHGIVELRQLTEKLSILPFVGVDHSGNRKAPQDLYDCTKVELEKLFNGKSVFPCSPFNDEEYIQHLKECKLQTSVRGPALLLILYEVAKQSQDKQSVKISAPNVRKAKAVLNYIRKHPDVLNDNVSYPNGSLHYSKFADALKSFSHNNFWLPICATPPSDYFSCLPWKGSACTSHVTLLSNAMVLCSNRDFDIIPHLVGSQMYIVECPSALSQVLCHTAVPIEAIFSHFKLIIKNKRVIKTDKLDEQVHLVYEYLEHHLPKVQSAYQTSSLCCENLIWWKSQHTFICPKNVILNNHSTFQYSNHLSPYFFLIPESLASYKTLLAHFGVRKTLTDSDIVSVLQMIKDDSENNHSRKWFSSMWVIVEHILNWLTNDGTESAYGEHLNNNSLYVPVDTVDAHKLYLMDVKKVVYSDCDHLKSFRKNRKSKHFIHKRVAHLAPYLGVKSLNNSVIEQYETKEQGWLGLPFGQHEELTQRIRNILEDYPEGISMLKELLQNADDAKAKKMYVILDMRSHGTQRLPSKEWQDLQGPALLVWNDSIFCEEDFKGIQQLGLGSKRSSADAIGQFGIGFNAVYHLTDCPSFLTNGTTLCILDPHCRYVPGASITKPGRRYEDINEDFWNNWSDLKATYLRQGSLSNCPLEIQTSGTLFRFPLRHNLVLAKKSELVSRKHSRISSSKTVVVTEQKMVNDLNSWAPKMKEALLFLKSVTELKFFRIDISSKMKVTHSFKAQLSKKALERRCEIQRSYDTYNNTKKPLTIHYPLSISEEMPNKSIDLWLIQQGVGDLQNPQQHWEYLPRKKPKHGLALLIKGNEFVGKIFCFLPLPSVSNLPVHINGEFILDSARSSLWNSRDSTDHDDRQTWNNHLLEAIASSYAQLLAICKDEYFLPNADLSPQEFKEATENYYNIFPKWLGKHSLDKEVKMLSKFVYKRLYELNYEVLIQSDSFKAKWLPLYNSRDISKQVYFCNDHLQQNMLLIFELIGLNSTAAPFSVREHFSDCDIDLPVVSPDAVFDYYCAHYPQVSEKFPCPISETRFQSVENFVTFLKYVLQKQYFEEKAGTFLKFPNPPEGIPLLLTSSEMLCYFSDDEKKKVICSFFSSIFAPECRNKFLHPEICKLKLSPNYFIKADANNWYLVSSILHATLPSSLAVQHIENMSDHNIHHSRLSQLWCCLQCDEVFQTHTEKIVKRWALLPTTTNELYSYTSNSQLIPIIPYYYNGDCPTSHVLEVFNILEEIGMPILDKKIVRNTQFCEKFCPQIHERERILRNLFYLNQQCGLKALLNVDLDHKIAVLFNYFGHIHFRHDHESLDVMKSLPLFKDISNVYCTLNGETWIWPSHTIPFSQRKVWMDNESVVFLSPEGDWTRLGETTVLGLTELDPLVVYTRFIFPHFHLLTDKERIDHLQLIRDHTNLFEEACAARRINFHPEKKRNGIKFINALKQLPCLPKDGKLYPINNFCNPDIPVFGLFLSNDSFPPEELTNDSKWLKFLCKLDLRTKATIDEFLIFCKKVADGKQKHIQCSSQALIEHLFENKDWHDQVQFLRTVCEISFVCADPLEHLNWFVPVASVDNSILQSGETTRLTSLSKAASSEVQNLIWAVKPVVTLPDTVNKLLASEEKREIFKYIHCLNEPSLEEVVRNVKQISQSRFANFNLFDHSPKECIPSKDLKELLCKALVDCFYYMKKCNCSKKDLQCLRDSHCIPIITKKFTVLVSPLQVVASTDSSGIISELVPFLNPLPDCLYSVLPDVLLKLGVASEIRYSNLRNALEVMSQYIRQPLDPNSIRIVHLILKRFHTVEVPATTSKPLYLPNEKKELVESTRLLYNDDERYKSAKFYIQSSPFSLISLLVNQYEERGVFGFNLKEFISLIPQTVRPMPLSLHCSEQLNVDCTPEAQMYNSEFITGLDTAFKFPDFATVIERILHASSLERCTCKKFVKSLSTFCKTVRVLGIPNLKVDVYLTLEEPSEFIGTVKVDYVISQNDDGFVIYINSGAKLKLRLLESLSQKLVSTVALLSEIDVEDISENVKKGIVTLLQDQSKDEIAALFMDLGLSTEAYEHLGDPYTKQFSVKLGSQIPDHLHHRLFADFNNIFRPQEIVGYEIANEYYIFVRIEYQVPGSSESGELDKYHITVSEDDEYGKDVAIIELCKILRMKDVVYNDSSSKEIIPCDADSEVPQFWDAHNNDTLKLLLNEVADELKKLWKIEDTKLRRKAIKSMYLKWHPDKNSSPFATKVFQYLKRQIERLEQGSDLEDPDSHNGEPNIGGLNSDLWQDCEETVRNRKEQWRRERRRREEDPSVPTADDVDEEIQRNSVNPDPDKASVWLKQANHDLTAMLLLLENISTKKEVCAHVCFMAHQVAEKALKAGMYKIIGLHSSVLRWHQLIGHASAIEQTKPTKTRGLREVARGLEPHYLNPRYPNRYSPVKVPSDQYSPERAHEAGKAAQNILNIINKLF